jgi:hypothetical protein
MYIIIIILLAANIAQHHWQELRRDSAVRNINNPATEEHNKLGQLMLDGVDKTLDIRKHERTAEHNTMRNDSEIIINNTDTIIDMLKNGTN